MLSSVLNKHYKAIQSSIRLNRPSMYFLLNIPYPKVLVPEVFQFLDFFFSDFGIFVYIQWDILVMGLKSEHEIRLCFTYTLCIQPKGNFIQYF